VTFRGFDECGVDSSLDINYNDRFAAILCQNNVESVAGA
jgi:hypothetical protein